MSATIIRLKKEARALFWPWCAVMLMGVLPAIHSAPSTRKLNLFSFFVGAPILAVLALGNEFQQRTFILWLTQPLNRARLWTEKMGVAFAAGIAVAIVSGTVTFSYVWPHLSGAYETAALVCVISAALSAPFWTLATRSTVGGFTLVTCHLALAFWIARAIAHQDELLHASISGAMRAVIVTCGAAYSVLMLWLGARKVSRLQLRGGGEDDDLLMSDRMLLSATLARWLRCRPSGALRNLVRKEIRLLLPFWLFSALVLGYLAVMTRLHLVAAFPLPIPEKDPGLSTWIAFMSLGCFSVLLPIFAGLLSLGSEKTTGTYGWHMSLPIASRQQWAVKISIAMLAGFISTVLLPLAVVIAVGAWLGAPYMFVNFRELGDWMRLVPVMTFAAFWCASAAQGTMRAAVWVAAAPIPVFYARPAGVWLAQLVTREGVTLRDVIVARLHLSPPAFANMIEAARGGVLWLFVPALLLGVFQSYRMYRRPQQESVGWVLRCLAPLVVITVVWSFATSAGFLASRWEPFVETQRAIERNPGARMGTDLAVGPLTQQWLSGARIEVAGGVAGGYVATVHLASGTDCRIRVNRFGGSAAVCGR